MSQTAKNQEITDRYKLCPACGYFSHVNEKQIYCIVCGETMIQECPKCQESIIYPTAKYCCKCGGSLTTIKS